LVGGWRARQSGTGFKTLNSWLAARSDSAKMSIQEIYSYPVLHRYKASAFSKAALVNILIALLTYLLPLFLAYRSYGNFIIFCHF
jgi:hypothetical protein